MSNYDIGLMLCHITIVLIALYNLVKAIKLKGILSIIGSVMTVVLMGIKYFIFPGNIIVDIGLIVVFLLSILMLYIADSRYEGKTGSACTLSKPISILFWVLIGLVGGIGLIVFIINFVLMSRV